MSGMATWMVRRGLIWAAAEAPCEGPIGSERRMKRGAVYSELGEVRQEWIRPLPTWGERGRSGSPPPAYVGHTE